MPTGRRPRRRGKNAKDAQVKEKSSNPEAPADRPDRPQTRAWTKAQQRTTGTVTAPAISQAPSKQNTASRSTGRLQNTKSNITTQPALEEVQSDELRNRSNKAKAVQSTAASVPVRNASHRVSGVSSPDSRRKPKSRLSQNPELSSWLNIVEPVSPEDPRVSALVDSPRVIGSRDESEDSMATSSSVSGASHILSDGVSTPRQVADVKKAQRAILDKLRTRRAVADLRTTDKKTEHFKSVLGVQKPITIPFKDTKALQTILKNFLQRCETSRPRENSYTAIEDLSNEINKWKPTFNLNTITNQDFKNDIAHCQHSNEAVFQRTVMISIIDRWQLNDMFDFNCEGHWSLQGTYPLPSTQGPDDKVTGPKPDLAIFFKFEALTGNDVLSFSAPVPPKLKSCIWPDNYLRRSFPFIFIEAKKGFHDLTFAVYANMHSASQALFNIYKWMEKAGHTDVFFEQVRLFSIAINAEKIIARVHRASRLAGEESLVFLYDELLTLYRYSRDEACLLIRNILVEYGVTELHGILKDTFEEVSRQYKEGRYQNDEPPKRKNDPIPDTSTKKARTSQNASQTTSPQIADPSSSFGASRIDISDD